MGQFIEESRNRSSYFHVFLQIDKLALENQVKERRMSEQQERMYEDVSQKNLIFYSEQAIQQEQMVRCLANR